MSCLMRKLRFVIFNRLDERLIMNAHTFKHTLSATFWYNEVGKVWSQCRYYIMHYIMQMQTAEVLKLYIAAKLGLKRQCVAFNCSQFL